MNKTSTRSASVFLIDDSQRISLPDTALVLEGGGMRAAYTSACIELLIHEKLDFGWVGGISAGSSLMANYMSRDRIRTRESFVNLGSDPRSGGWGSFIRGRGYFDSEYIYETAPLPTEPLPFRWEEFLRHPAQFRVGAIRADNGEMVHWGRDDIGNIQDLMRRVRASSTLPFFMIPPEIDGVTYFDGALGPAGGVPIDAAEADGFEKFLVIMTQPRDYRKTPVSRPGVIRRAFKKYPALAEAIIARPERYNTTREHLLELESQGKAMLFFPDEMPVRNRTRNIQELQAAYQAGAAQTAAAWPQWREFLKV